MDDFQTKDENELDRLGDEGLLAYLAAARDAGRLPAARTAAGLLAFRHLGIVTARVRARVPDWAVEDLVMEVMQSAIRSSFDGKFIGQYKLWLKTITHRRIADFTDANKRKPPPLPLPGQGEEDDGDWVEPGKDDETLARLPNHELAEQLRAKVPNPMHRLVIQLYGLEVLGYGDMTAAETKEAVRKIMDQDVSEANIHKIWQRFSDDLRDAIEQAESVDGE